MNYFEWVRACRESMGLFSVSDPVGVQKKKEEEI